MSHRKVFFCNPESYARPGRLSFGARFVHELASSPTKPSEPLILIAEEVERDRSLAENCLRFF
jgi:hypothetical protein